MASSPEVSSERAPIELEQFVDRKREPEGIAEADEPVAVAVECVARTHLPKDCQEAALASDHREWEWEVFHLLECQCPKYIIA